LSTIIIQKKGGFFMNTFKSTPQCLTRVLGMTNDEYNMVGAALQYTLNHILYDTRNDNYYFYEHLPWKKRTVLAPEKFDVLEKVAFRILGELMGRKSK
jgi:hypothetical protein